MTSGTSGGRQWRAFPSGWWISSQNRVPVLASHPPALVQLKGNLIRKINSMRTNIQFGNLLRVGVFFFFNTLEDFALILLLGLLIN